MAYLRKLDQEGQNSHLYRQLEHDDSIRLKVLPAEDHDSKLQCVLVHCRLQDNPPYEAISYVWGSPILSERLDSPDGCFEITISMALALRRFRLKDTERLLWTDAVCINQANNEEKGHQVAQMGTIYKSATGVLAWLGAATQDTQQVIQDCKRLAATAANYHVEDKDLDFKVFVGPELKELDDSGKETTISFNDARVEEIQSVLHDIRDSKLESPVEMPWFGRLWIIQEVASSQKTTLHWGNDELDWSILASAVRLLVAVLKFGVHPFIFGENIEEDMMTASISRAWNIILIRNEFRVMSRPSVGDIDIVNRDIRILNDAGLWCRSSDSVNVVETTDISSSDYLPSWVPEYRPSKLNGGLLPWNVERFETWDPLRPSPAIPPGIYDHGNEENVLALSVTVLDTVAFQILCLDPETARNVQSGAATTRGLASLAPNSGFAGGRTLIGLIRNFSKMTMQDDKYVITGQDNRAVVARTLVADATHSHVRKQMWGAFDAKNEVEMIALWDKYERCCVDAKGELSIIFDESRKGIPSVPRLSDDAKDAFEFMQAAMYVLERCQFIVSKTGYFGLVPKTTGKDDIIVRIRGVKVPFVVRPVGTFKKHVLIGPCFIQGIMKKSRIVTTRRR